MIDSQVHFREPGSDHKEDLESGSRAAALGGITTFFEMPNTNPLTIDERAFNDKLNRAKGRCWTDYAFYLGGSAANAERLGKLEKMPGCCGIKIFMGASTGDLLSADDDTIREILRHGKRVVAVHAEDNARLNERKHLVEGGAGVSVHPEWRDVEVCRLATERVLRLARETGRRIHVLHIIKLTIRIAPVVELQFLVPLVMGLTSARHELLLRGSGASTILRMVNAGQK